MKPIVALLFLLSVGCVDASDGLPAPPAPDSSLEELLNDEASIVGSAGFTVGPDNYVARVVDAQLSRIDSTVWIVDNVAPYVRRFSPRGQQIARFVNHGDGPGEARGVGSIAGNDSLIAVAHSGMVSIYRHSGELIASHIRFPFITERIGTGCDGEWLISGRTPLDETGARASGMFAVRLTPGHSPVIRTLERDTSATPIHGPRRFHTASRITTLDVRRTPKTIAATTCPVTSFEEVITLPLENILERWSGNGSRRVISVQHLSDSRRVTGFASDGENVFVSFITASGSSMALYHQGVMRAEVASEHHYTVLDAFGGKVLIRRTETVPGVVWVRTQHLIRLMTGKRGDVHDPQGS